MPSDVHTGTWVTYHQGQASGLSLRKCRLVVVAGPDTGLECELAQQRICVGARPGADLVLSDTGVSRLHFEIQLDESGYRLRDLGSTNGTFIGGHRVYDAAINPGSVIEIGDTRIQFEPKDASVDLPLWSDDAFGGLVGRSAVMRELFARLSKLAAIDATVIITGETGTGKDMVAESLHMCSPRRDKPFVVLDCGSIAPNLIESEVFGHEKGAFTGAMASYAGAFERADGGTLFLDEIGELPIELQPKLLRVLERQNIRRVGGTAVTPVNVRLLAATNRDLAREVNSGRFREDLYYRLAVAPVVVPPLRDHKDDIEVLVEHFLSHLPGGNRTVLQPRTLKTLQKHDWPGNVRELRNVVERAALLSEEPTSPTSLRRGAPRASFGAEHTTHPDAAFTEDFEIPVDLSVPLKQAKQAVIDEFERRYVSALLERYEYNISAAARAAGTTRMTIHKIAERLGLRKKPRS